MLISEILMLESVFLDVKATSKKQLIQELARRVANTLKLEERVVFDVLVERERLGTTGFGNGVAIPHAKLSKVDGLHMMFVRLVSPINFDAIDGLPIDLVFLLLTPENAGADHLKALAKASRILRDEALCAKIRGAETAEAIYSLILES